MRLSSPRPHQQPYGDHRLVYSHRCPPEATPGQPDCRLMCVMYEEQPQLHRAYIDSPQMKPKQQNHRESTIFASPRRSLHGTSPRMHHARAILPYSVGYLRPPCNLWLTTVAILGSWGRHDYYRPSESRRSVTRDFQGPIEPPGRLLLRLTALEFQP